MKNFNRYYKSLFAGRDAAWLERSYRKRCMDANRSLGGKSQSSSPSIRISRQKLQQGRRAVQVVVALPWPKKQPLFGGAVPNDFAKNSSHLCSCSCYGTVVIVVVVSEATERATTHKNINIRPQYPPSPSSYRYHQPA
jgi:hypothetical protein